jgi:hypothetical protein
LRHSSAAGCRVQRCLMHLQEAGSIKIREMALLCKSRQARSRRFSFLNRRHRSEQAD